MDPIVALVALLALSIPFGLASGWFVSRGPAAMAGLFRPDRGLGWPHGVQEEDPPAGWGWRIPERDAPVATPGPATVRVVPRLGRGSSRR